jgi:two-component system CheB/CheR fusion protein
LSELASAKSAFPIVGIGASAGGLEALHQFFLHVPQNCGLAFVVVQHLDPAHKGFLPELLQRATSMPVVEITDLMKIERDRIHVIPPNRDLSLLHGVLHLLEPASARGLRLPIDFFFRSLAEDQQELGIGVILSGMGSDGTLGLGAIKEKAGAVFVQAPETAKFDAMPRSAISAGLADVVAPTDQLPGRITAYLAHAPLPPHTAPSGADPGDLEKIIIVLRSQTGQDFSLYKKSTIHRRIERRMALHQLPNISDYLRYLRANAQESELLFKELLIGVTNFFRDPAVWDQLKADVLPELLASRPNGGALRAWVPACSTGEEAYTLAMLFREAIDQARPTRDLSIHIFATDLDKDAIDKARAAIYPANIAADVSPDRLRRFFVEEDRGYRISKEIREMVVFAPQNIAMDPPFTKLDILSCRNLLIYLEPELQRKLISLFHYSLNPGGVLILGTAESSGANDLFGQLAGKTRIFRRLDRTRSTRSIDFPVVFSPARTPHGGMSPGSPDMKHPVPNLQALADHLLLQTYAPAAVLVSDTGDILYVSGKTGRYLEPAAGKANWNIVAMAREGLDSALIEAFRRALASEKKAVTVKGIRVGAPESSHCIDLTVQPVTEPGPLEGLIMIIFADVANPPTAPPATRTRGTTDQRARLAALTLELQTMRELMQTSQEELRATNEELQSTNEELQSSNEELTTSKEEMQSMNEELQTVNNELQAKLDELSRTNNDMTNLLNGTGIAILFLDDNLNVRRFTPPTTRILRLIPGDAGRPVTDLTGDLDYPALQDDARTVLRTLVFTETSVPTHDGRWFTVRIMPYRTLDNRIDGVVITFTDISAAKRLEEELRATESRLRQLPQAPEGSGADS